MSDLTRTWAKKKYKGSWLDSKQADVNVVFCIIIVKLMIGKIVFCML